MANTRGIGIPSGFHAKRARNCVKRERPSWWAPEGVIERLQGGTPIALICQTAAEEMAGAGVVLSPVTLRGEVSKWQESATWGEQLKAALALWKKSSSGELVLSKDWHADFLAAMDHCGGNAEEAVKVAGVGLGVVLAVLDRRNGCYDKEFAEKYRIAELARVGRIRERYMKVAEEGEGKGALRAQERVIEAALPSLHGTKQEVHVSGRVEHEHEHEHRHAHLHGVAPELMREVALASQTRVRRINAGRQGQHILPPDTREEEGSVIDLAPAKETAPTATGSD